MLDGRAGVQAGVRHEKKRIGIPIPIYMISLESFKCTILDSGLTLFLVVCPVVGVSQAFGGGLRLKSKVKL